MTIRNCLACEKALHWALLAASAGITAAPAHLTQKLGLFQSAQLFKKYYSQGAEALWGAAEEHCQLGMLHFHTSHRPPELSPHCSISADCSPQAT